MAKLQTPKGCNPPLNIEKNVWADMLDVHIVGLYFLEENPKGQLYSDIPDPISLTSQKKMRSSIEITSFSAGRGTSSLMAISKDGGLAKSPDLTPLDFFSSGDTSSRRFLKRNRHLRANYVKELCLDASS